MNPSAELSQSERARLAWAPLRTDRLNQPPTLSAHSSALLGSGSPAEPTGTASVTPAAKSAPRGGPAASARDADAVLDRLERENHRDSRAICRGC